MNRTRITWLPTLALLSAFGLTSACAGGDDKRCSNSSQCAESESCEAGVCRPACTEGVDCPEKDVSGGDASQSDADGGIDGGDGGDVLADGGSDAADDTGDDGDADISDGGPEVPLEDELACDGDRTLLTTPDGSAFEVRVGDKTSGRIALPEGWKVEPACCGAGCCQ
jgi:hypothetical protein